MSENLFCPGQKTTSEEYRAHWDRIFAEGKDCDTCRYSRVSLGGEPCASCVDLSQGGFAYSKWEGRG